MKQKGVSDMVISRYTSAGIYNINNTNTNNSNSTNNVDIINNVDSTINNANANAADKDNNVYNSTSVSESDNTNVNSSDASVEDGKVSYGKMSASQAPKHSNPSDFTFDFRHEKRFNLEGATKDYEDINVGKALSDMKKDTVLDKYKFFVDTPNLGTDADGTVKIVRR